MAKKHKINEMIKAKEVMAIDIDGTQCGVMPLQEAIDKARSRQLDLVEVSPDTDPPVCKIMDFGRFRYKTDKKKHESKKKVRAAKVKEVKMTPTIGEHDYKFKVEHIKKFLKDGDRVKVTIFFKGRMIVHKELGEAVMARVVEDIKEVSQVEQEIKLEGHNITMVLIGA
ncbi:MAG: translation initiation factor IF-3 [Nitrospinae bacterium]|nr:translation initiation factor IF-3 [Nitrospinota bacterium]